MSYTEADILSIRIQEYQRGFQKGWTEGYDECIHRIRQGRIKVRKDRAKPVKKLYISVGKSIEMEYFEPLLAPMGWFTKETLKEKLKDKDYRAKFTKTELEQLAKVGV